MFALHCFIGRTPVIDCVCRQSQRYLLPTSSPWRRRSTRSSSGSSRSRRTFEPTPIFDLFCRGSASNLNSSDRSAKVGLLPLIYIYIYIYYIYIFIYIYRPYIYYLYKKQYMYIYIYICVCVCMCVSICVLLCVCVCVCVCTCVHVYVCIWVRMYVCVCMYVCHMTVWSLCNVKVKSYLFIY